MPNEAKAYCRLTQDQEEELRTLISAFDDPAFELHMFLAKLITEWRKARDALSDDIPSEIAIAGDDRLNMVCSWSDALDEVRSQGMDVDDLGETYDPDDAWIEALDDEDSGSDPAVEEHRGERP